MSDDEGRSVSIRPRIRQCATALRIISYLCSIDARRPPFGPRKAPRDARFRSRRANVHRCDEVRCAASCRSRCYSITRSYVYMTTAIADDVNFDSADASDPSSKWVQNRFRGVMTDDNQDQR